MRRRMNIGVRTALGLQTIKCPLKHHRHNPQQTSDKEVEEKESMLQETRLMDLLKETSVSKSKRERRVALQQDVDKLKKKLRYEENVHRALEQALYRRPGTPLLPKHLPRHTSVLLAEVVQLEEEVVRLEEQVLAFRRELYQEAIHISSFKKRARETVALEAQVSETGSSHLSLAQLLDYSDSDCNEPSSTSPRPSSSKISNQNWLYKPPRIRVTASKVKQQRQYRTTRGDGKEKNLWNSSDISFGRESGSPNAISENIMMCLIRIFTTMSSSENKAAFKDPYGICMMFRRRDVGPYRHFHSVDKESINPNMDPTSSPLFQKLKLLLRKLAFADLRGLSHQKRLAFWINIYNSCIMNAFVEHGIPDNQEMVVTVMQKAMINVGGNLLSAMTIEHSLLRLPYHSKYVSPKSFRNIEFTMQSVPGLDRPEPLVTFALSCGSWSSPAVRVYTAAQVEKELETAKKEYLQAAIGISLMNKLVIPKLLDWYLVDFAKDVESLLKWICLQLPSRLRGDVVKCIERSRRDEEISEIIQVMPYEFNFRYLIAT